MSWAKEKTLFIQVKLNSEEGITEFSNQFNVPSELVKTYTKHLQHLNFTKQLRSASAEQQEGQRKNDKHSEDCNWEELLTGGLKSYYVFKLDKCLQESLHRCAGFSAIS